MIVENPDQGAALAALANLSQQDIHAILKLAASQQARKRSPFFNRLDAAMVEIKERETYITSLPNEELGGKGGVVFAATKRIAAERIASQTHRLSAPEEREAFIADFNRRTYESAHRNNAQAALDNAVKALETVEPSHSRRTIKKGEIANG